MTKFFILLVSLILSSVLEDKREKTNHSAIEISIRSNTEGITTYYLIRHAEKQAAHLGNVDVSLSEKGNIRANKWKVIFKDIKFDAIYSTNYQRTLLTAKPTAQYQNLKVQIYQPNELFGSDFLKETKGKTILIVGHSNTTPAFANALLKENVYPITPEDGYGKWYKVIIDAKGEVTCNEKSMD